MAAPGGEPSPDGSIGSLLEEILRAVSLEVSGEIVLEVVFSEGRMRKAWIRRGPLTNEGLERDRRTVSEARSRDSGSR